jgi:undecaprenyl-diphosphatase
MSPAALLLRVAHSDDWVSERVGRWRTPAWVEVFLIAATRLGDGWAWLAVLVIAAGPAGHAPGRALSETASAIVAVNVAQVGLKQAFRRTRPSSRPRRVRAPDRFSFPSGHAMNAFAVAVLVAVHEPAAGPWAFAGASGVAASRVVLGLHYPSDVAAGTVLGSVLAALVASLLG